MRTLATILVLALSLFTPEFLMAADVPHPALPEGAGPIDADAPKEFTTTPSGLKYRVLRKGAGGKPKATNTVEVKQMEAKTLEKLLRFIYTDQAGDNSSAKLF